MAFNANEFLTDLLKDVQIDDAKKAALTEVLGNSVVAKRLEDSTLRQAEFSRLANEYKNGVQKAQEYWNGLQDWKKSETQRFEQERQALIKKLADEGISLDGVKVEQTPVAQGITKEEFQKFGQDALAYANTINKLGMQYLKEFGEVLDPDDLVKISAENGGINVNLAFEKFIQPKREAAQKADFAKQLAAAREEGKAEAQKNFTMPTADQPWRQGPHPTDVVKDGGPKLGAMAASQAYMEAIRSGKPIPEF